MPTDTPITPTRRWRRLLVAALALTAGAGLLLASPGASVPASAAASAAQPESCGPRDAYLAVLQVEGRMDAVLVDFITSQVRSIEGTCAVGIMLQLDSQGASGDSGDLEEMLRTVEGSSRPVGVWVGPSGSRALAEAADLLAVADQTGLAPGSHIEVTADLVAARGLTSDDLGTTAVGDRIGADRALELGLVDSDAPVVKNFAVTMPDVETREVSEDDDAGVEPVTPVVFAKLPLGGQLMHTVASAPVAYLLFVIGLALLLFELFSAGVGIAGMVGAASVLLGSYGLVSLPTNPVGVALILLAMFGYAVDVQTGVPRAWTAIATVSFVAGSLWLFDGVSLSWITLLFAFIGITVFMLRGMPVMVRSRFSTSAIDRGWLVGETGTAETALSPEGTVTLRDAPWRATAKAAAPIEPGSSVEVVGIDGFMLQVAPPGGTGDTATDAVGDSSRSSR